MAPFRALASTKLATPLAVLQPEAAGDSARARGRAHGDVHRGLHA